MSAAALSSNRLLLGIDCGTTVVKSVLFSLDGDEITVARREMPLVQPFAGASEVEMRAVWTLTAETIREVVATLPDVRQIEAVGFSGTACGFWAVDNQGEPLRNAILWNDARAADILAEWHENGFFADLFDRSGNTPFPGYPLSTLAWLKAHEPETLDRVAYLLFHKDWLRSRLTGEYSTDVSDASYFPWDIRNRAYSPALLQKAGIGNLLQKLPAAHESWQLVGAVTPEATAETGLATGTSVAAGAVDVVASLLGGGAYGVGQACSILGTSFLNTIIADSPTFQPRETGVQACIPEGRTARSLVNTSGTMCIEWMIRTLAPPEWMDGVVYERVEAAVQAVPPGAHGLVFLPLLNTAGMISPFADPNARGEFFGLSAEHTRADLMRAVYEGVAFAMRDCYEAAALPVNEILLVGGGARSSFWAQLFADVVGRRIAIPNGTEFGARGAALLAGVGAGIYPSLEKAIRSTVRVERVFEPRAEITRVYDLVYPLYKHLLTGARSGWAMRGQILSTLASFIPQEQAHA